MSSAIPKVLKDWNSNTKRTKKQQSTLILARQKMEEVRRQEREEREKESDQEDEEDSFVGSGIHIEMLEERAGLYEKSYRNEVKKTKRAQASIKKKTVQFNKKESLLKAENRTLKNEVKDLTRKLKNTEAKQEMSAERIEIMREDKENLNRDVRRLDARVSRAADKTMKAVSKAVANAKQEINTFQVKEDGIVSATARDMARNLVSLRVKPSHVGPAVRIVLEGAGQEVVGDISHTTARRAVVEGGIAAELQLVEAMKESDGFIISSDGSTHKSINYESHFITVNKGNSHKNFFSGLTTAPNHKSQTQCDEWESLFRKITGLYNTSPKARKDGNIDVRELLRLLCGMLTDHAEDQIKLRTLIEDLKRTWDREVRGEDEVLSLGMLQLLPLISESNQIAIATAGGPEAWDLLTEEDRHQKSQASYLVVLRRLGQEKFDGLSETEQRTIDLFVSSGCDAHKDLNSVKGGNEEMMKFWAENHIPGPVKLMNRANVDAAKLGGAAGRNAIEKSLAGAVKLTSIAGALFNHKDDKAGHQNTFRFWMEQELGHLLTMPDTSNNRFQSHARAAEQIILHLYTLRKFMLHVKDKKDARTWNNLEHNFWLGINDPATIQELCVLALYCQSVSVPYMEYVRGNPNLNGLDLGPYHDSILTHCQSIINDPELLLSPAATSHDPATLNGEPFESPEVVYAVQCIIQDSDIETLYIQPLLQKFFTGALNTWPRFMKEFAQGGPVLQMSPEERLRAWRNTTNDLNESAFGILRRNWRFAGHTSILYHNSRVMYKMNGTSEYVADADHSVRTYMIREARRRMDSNDEKANREALVAYSEEVVKGKRDRDAVRKERVDAHHGKLLALAVIIDPGSIPAKITVPAIDLQLDWHRVFRKEAKVPLKSKCGRNRAEKLETLKKVIEGFKASGKTAGECILPAESPTAVLEVEEDTMDIDDEEDLEISG